MVNNTAKGKKLSFTTKEMVLTAMFAAIMAVCSWISIPIGEIAITLQTFAVFCALGILGGRNGLFSILVFILLGAIGLPVFSGFKGGIGVLTGPTGGYILGFIFMALIYMAGERLFGKKLAVKITLMLIGLAVCYTFGTLWFVFVFSKNGSSIPVSKALKLCVTPFIPFDVIKLILALIITDRVKKHINI
jgi:biotin transport system substrate-specific component